MWFKSEVGKTVCLNLVIKAHWPGEGTGLELQVWAWPGDAVNVLHCCRSVPLQATSDRRARLLGAVSDLLQPLAAAEPPEIPWSRHIDPITLTHEYPVPRLMCPMLSLLAPEHLLNRFQNTQSTVRTREIRPQPVHRHPSFPASTASAILRSSEIFLLQISRKWGVLYLTDPTPFLSDDLDNY